MEEKLPKIATKFPIRVHVESGKKYFWCSCGLSKNQPFCDGSHRGSEFRPKSFTLTEKKKVALCQCKHTANPPFCDGTHSKL